MKRHEDVVFYAFMPYSASLAVCVCMVDRDVLQAIMDLRFSVSILP